MAAHDFIKQPLIGSCIANNNFYIMCSTETFLDSIISKDKIRINMAGYSLIRADHPRNTIKGGVCIYYRVLRLIKKDDISDIKEY